MDSAMKLDVRRCASDCSVSYVSETGSSRSTDTCVNGVAGEHCSSSGTPPASPRAGPAAAPAIETWAGNFAHGASSLGREAACHGPWLGEGVSPGPGPGPAVAQPAAVVAQPAALRWEARILWVPAAVVGLPPAAQAYGVMPCSTSFTPAREVTPPPTEVSSLSGAAAVDLDSAAAHFAALAQQRQALAQQVRASQQHRGGADGLHTIVRCGSGGDAEVVDSGRTTLMLRNLPNPYSRDMLLDLLVREGFSGDFDFVYYPIDFKTWVGFGYAFVNFVRHAQALRAWQHFDGFSRWQESSEKVVEVCWGNPLQGREDCIERYRNSPVMHETVPEECKPVMLRNGRRILFPVPTKRIRCPRFNNVSSKTWEG